MIPAGAERRLRGHVDRVLRTAHVPAAEREELADELFGHLVERWQSLVRDGLSEAAATERAVRDFGTAERIGRDLTRTYRGRFWASTIGVLLPASGPGTAPGSPSSTALSVLMYVFAGVTFSAALGALTSSPPILSVLQASAWGIGSGLLLLTGIALSRGQRWALLVSLAVSGFVVVEGVVSYVHDPNVVPLTGFGSAVVLGMAFLGRRRLWRSTTLGHQAKPFIAAVITASLIGSYASGPLLAAFDDPTQAVEEDLAFEVRVRCDTAFEPTVDAKVLRWRVDLFWEWSRTGVLPGGLRGWERYTDMLVLRYPGEEWWLADTQPPEEALSRRQIGWQGGGAPAEGVIPPDMPRNIVDFAVLTRDTRASVRYQAAWVMKSQTDTTAWPGRAEAWYFHGDRWALAATAGCDQSGEGVPATVAED